MSGLLILQSSSQQEIQKMDISINITEYTPYESNNFLMDNTGKITRELDLKVFLQV